MKTLTGSFSFKVPSTHPEAGKKVDGTFTHQEVETDAEASEIMTERKLTTIGLLNAYLKANARSNAYQTAVLPYKPSEVPAEEIVERMVRDFIRMGLTEADARVAVAETLAKRAAAAASDDAEVTE